MKEVYNLFITLQFASFMNCSFDLNIAVSSLKAVDF